MILVISIGNSLRNDDGAGHALGDRMEEICGAHGLHTRRLAVHQLNPELAAEIAEISPEMVVFTDARDCTQPGSVPGLILRRLCDDTRTCTPLGHHLTPETLLVYTQALFGARPEAWMITAPGYDFSHGERLSAATERTLLGVDELVASILSPARTMA